MRSKTKDTGHDKHKARKNDDHRSERHIRYQERVSGIITRFGMGAEMERIYRCQVQGLADSIPYRVDVTAEGKGRHILIEIDGPFGHSTKQSYIADSLKVRRIRHCYGNGLAESEDKGIEFYAFTFKQLAEWSDQEIAEEMKLHLTRNEYELEEFFRRYKRDLVLKNMNMGILSHQVLETRTDITQAQKIISRRETEQQNTRLPGTVTRSCILAGTH